MTQTIEQLQARVAELEYQLNTEIGSYASAKITELEAENARLKAEEDHLDGVVANWKSTASALNEQLVAEQADSKRLRDALKASDDLLRDLPSSGGFYGLAVMEANTEALAHPTDTSALDAFVAEKVKEVQLQDIEQYRLQMAGISTAAIGYWKEGDSIHPDYDTPALRDVAKLYASYESLTRQRDLAVEALDYALNAPDGVYSEVQAEKLMSSALSIIKESETQNGC